MLRQEQARFAVLRGRRREPGLLESLLDEIGGLDIVLDDQYVHVRILHFLLDVGKTGDPDEVQQDVE